MISPESRALLMMDAKRAITLLGLDADRESALADMVVANMEAGINALLLAARAEGVRVGRRQVEEEKS